MKLKGEWDSGTTYDVGDVVAHEDGFVYHLRKPCPAGTAPVDTLYWAKLEQTLAQAALFVLDIASSIPKNVSEEAISLKTDDGEYLITVDDSGDTPELAVTAVEEEAET